jgi:hypothetical protein
MLLFRSNSKNGAIEKGEQNDRPASFILSYIAGGCGEVIQACKIMEENVFLLTLNANSTNHILYS